MLVNRQKDKKKVMVLVPCVGGVLLYFVFGVLPMMSRMKQDTTPTATPLQTTAANTASNDAANTTSASPGPNMPAGTLPSPLLVDMNPPADITNDPFKPPIAAPGTGVDAALAAPVKTAAAIPPDQVGGLHPGALATQGPIGTGIGTRPAVGAAIAPAAAEATEITLQGVVLGEHAVGVFRTGDQTFYKRIGDVVVDKMVLKLVSDNGVVLRKGKQLFTLEIGHSDLSPTTILAPPVSSTMTKSTVLIDRAAAAYRATEKTTTGAPPLEVHMQQPLQLQSAQSVQFHTQQPHNSRSAPTIVPASTRSHQSDRVVASDVRADKSVVRPAVKAETEKIVVSGPNLVADSGRVTSVPTDGLSPEIRQTSIIVDKKTRVRHKRRARHARGARRHPARTRRRA